MTVKKNPKKTHKKNIEKMLIFLKKESENGNKK